MEAVVKEVDLLQRLGAPLLDYLGRIDEDIARLTVAEQRAKLANLALAVLRETHDVVPRHPTATTAGQHRRSNNPAPGQFVMQLPGSCDHYVPTRRR